MAALRLVSLVNMTENGRVFCATCNTWFIVCDSTSSSLGGFFYFFGHTPTHDEMALQAGGGGARPSAHCQRSTRAWGV